MSLCPSFYIIFGCVSCCFCFLLLFFFFSVCLLSLCLFIILCTYISTSPLSSPSICSISTKLSLEVVRKFHIDSTHLSIHLFFFAFFFNCSAPQTFFFLIEYSSIVCNRHGCQELHKSQSNLARELTVWG